MSYPYIGGPAPGPSTLPAGPSSQSYSLPPPHMHSSSSGPSYTNQMPPAQSGHGQQLIMGWNGYAPSSNGNWANWTMGNNGQPGSSYSNHEQMVGSHQLQTAYPFQPADPYNPSNGYDAQESGYTGQHGVPDCIAQNGVEGSPTHKKHFDTAFTAPAINLGTGNRFSELLEAKMNMISGNHNSSESVMMEDPQSSSSSSTFDYRTYSSYTLPTPSSTGPQMSVSTSYYPSLPQTPAQSSFSVTSTPPVTNHLGRADLYNSGPPPPPDPIEAKAQAQAQQAQTMSAASNRYSDSVAFSGRPTAIVDLSNLSSQPSGSGSAPSDWMPAPLQYSIPPPPPLQTKTTSLAGLIPNARSQRLDLVSPPSHQLPHPGHHAQPAVGTLVEQPRSYEPSTIDRRLHDPSATHIQPDLVAPLPSEVSYYKSRKDYQYLQNGSSYNQEYGQVPSTALPAYITDQMRPTFPPQPLQAKLAYDHLQPTSSNGTYTSQPPSSPAPYPSQPIPSELSKRNGPSPTPSNLLPPSANYPTTQPANSQSSSTRISPPSSSLIQPKSAQLPPLPSWQQAQSRIQPSVLPWDSDATSQPSGGTKKQHPEILPPLLKVNRSGKGVDRADGRDGTESTSNTRPSTPAKFSISTNVRASMLKDKKKAKGKGKGKSKDEPIEDSPAEPSARPEKKKRKTAIDSPTDTSASSGKSSAASAPASKAVDKTSAAMSASTSTESSSKKSLPEKTVIACNNCRAKKLKCNGERPRCYHCTRRGEDACMYEAILRRRGPGRNNKEKKSKDDGKKGHDSHENDSTAASSTGRHGGLSPDVSGFGSGSSSDVEELEDDHTPHQAQPQIQSQDSASSNSAKNYQRPSGRPNLGMGGGDRGDDSHRLNEEDIKGMEYILGNNKGADRLGTGLGMGFGGLSMGSGSRFELSTARD
ncbi:hypothetical protein IAU59_000974 [Kwoniella sp. CBS 9459]